VTQLAVIFLESDTAHFTFPPFEGCLSIVGHQEAINGVSDLARRGKAGAAQSLPRENAEPDFDLVEPAGMSRGVMEVNMGVACQPAIPLRFMAAEIDVGGPLSGLKFHFVRGLR
jgi:hypothetical protein